MLQIGSSGVSSLSRVALVACSQVSFVSVSRLLTSLLEAPLHRQLGSSVIARLPCCPQRMLANSSSSCRSRSTTPPVMAWSAATMRAPGCICTSGVASALRNGPTAVARAHLASGKTLPQRRLQLAASGRQSAVAWGGKLPRRAPVPQLDHGAGSGAGAGGRGGGRIGFSGRSGGAGGGDASSGNGGGGGLWAAYSSLLEAHPLMVKAVTTALLSALGNIICQVAIEHVKELDGRRLGIFTALGFFWVTPCLHFWFGALNRCVCGGGVLHTCFVHPLPTPPPHTPHPHTQTHIDAAPP